MNISDLSKARVVVVGDAILDVYIHGRVDRISPEAPVPVFVEERREEMPGGADNVAENLRALGCDWRLVSPDARPIKTRFMVNNRQMFRHDREEEGWEISPAMAGKLFEQVDNGAPCDVLIISDYAKGCCTPLLCQELIRWAKEKGVKVVVDPKGDDWSKYNGADLLTPNEAEWEAMTDLGLHGDALVTSGANGMRLVGTDFQIPATNTGPVDTTGAGDTVVAVLAAAIAVGFDLEQAARLANAAAGVAVSKFGTATVSLAELEKAMGQSEAKRAIVGFANGVFDCFHDGHKHFLRECLMNCDRLVVAVNNDCPPKKPPPRDSVTVRLNNVKPYAETDLFHDEADLLALMQRVKPDVIFKGEDYRDKPITGGDLARIHWVARHPGYSSTIERARGYAWQQK